MVKDRQTDSSKGKEAKTEVTDIIRDNTVAATLTACKAARDKSMSNVELQRSVLKLSMFGSDIFVSEMGKRAAIALDEAVEAATEALAQAKLAAVTFAPLVK